MIELKGYLNSKNIAIFDLCINCSGLHMQVGGDKDSREMEKRTCNKRGEMGEKVEAKSRGKEKRREFGEEFAALFF